MSRVSTRRRAASLDRQRKGNREIRTTSTGLGLRLSHFMVLAASAAAAVAVWGLLLRPAQADLSAVDSEVSDTQEQVDQLAERLENIKAGNPDELAALQRVAESADQLLPQANDEIAGLTLLVDHAARFGISLAPDGGSVTASPVPSASVRPFKLAVNTTPANLQAWLDDLDTLRPMVTVAAADVSLTAEGQADAKVTVWVWSVATAPLPAQGS